MLSPLPSVQSTKPANTDTINIIAKQAAGIHSPRHSSDSLLLSMDRGGNAPHHNHEISKNPEMVRLCRRYSWWPQHFTNRQRKLHHLSRIQKHPKSIGNRTAHCSWILAAGEWISGRFNEVPLKFIQTLLAKERSGMNSSQRCFETIALRHISPQERHQHYP